MKEEIESLQRNTENRSLVQLKQTRQAVPFVHRVINNSMSLLDMDLPEPVAGAISRVIVEEYPHLKQEELNEAFMMGVTGKFGKMYGKFNILVVSEWLSKYAELQTIKRENEHLDRKAAGVYGDTSRATKSLRDVLSTSKPFSGANGVVLPKGKDNAANQSK